VTDEEDRRAKELLSAIQRRLDDHEKRLEGLTRATDGLRAAVELLTKLLVAKEVLASGHERIMAKVAERPPAPPAPVREGVRLAVYEDKHQVANSDVDCEARLPLCHARCCTFEFLLSSPDLDDGIKFELDLPYEIRHEADRYCSHYDRRRGGCGTYATRPATCRTYTCKNDKRVWLDFERRIPAPLAEGIVVPEVLRGGTR
jgi:Fe-S-cluster containining protein